MRRYAISHRRALPPHPQGPLAALEEQVSRWAAAGVEWIQLREKDLSPPDLEALTRCLAARLHGSPSRLLVNGLPAVRALACGAHGVHLPGESSSKTIRTARATIETISVSCHTLADIAAAAEGGATLALWAPVFNKTIDGDPVQSGTGLEALRSACTAAASGPTPVPIFALGGVTPQNAEACQAAGAAGVAGIRLFAGDDWRQIASWQASCVKEL